MTNIAMILSLFLQEHRGWFHYYSLIPTVSELHYKWFVINIWPDHISNWQSHDNYLGSRICYVIDLYEQHAFITSLNRQWPNKILRSYAHEGQQYWSSRLLPGHNEDILCPCIVVSLLYWSLAVRYLDLASKMYRFNSETW